MPAENLCEKEDTALIPAARCYACVAAMRVDLNAPNTPELAEGRKKARAILKTWGKSVLKDKNIRKKTRYGLNLCLRCRPLAKLVYK